MRLEINPEYNYLENFVLSLPNRFEKDGTCIYDGRNKIKVFEESGLSLNVKSYKIPIFFNRIAYTFFRKSKAYRAFSYAFELQRRGVETPTPIAYLETRKGGLLHRSYFVSLQFETEGNLREFLDEDTTNEGKEELMDAFAEFTAELHEKEVLHIDYSPGNILYKRVDDHYLFSLIDINRMAFRPVSLKEGCYNFRRICGNDNFFTRVATRYAQKRGFDEKECVRLFLRYKYEDREQRSRKKRFKKFFGKN